MSHVRIFFVCLFGFFFSYLILLLLLLLPGNGHNQRVDYSAMKYLGAHASKVKNWIKTNSAKIYMFVTEALKASSDGAATVPGGNEFQSLIVRGKHEYLR